MDVLNVTSYLPHRPPIVVIDKVVDIIPGQSGTGIKHFKENDSFFQGHFPGFAILPGIYVIEAFAQTAMIVVAVDSPSPSEPRVGFLAKVEQMSFYRKIEPGQEVTFTTHFNKKIGAFILFDCIAEHWRERCAQGEIILTANPQTPT